MYPDLHVLLVDDDPGVRGLLEVLFTSIGASVDAVGDAVAARLRVAKRVPDVAIIDVMMPGTDGITLLKLLRADPAYKDIPICMLTARDQRVDIMSGYLAGADAYMTKPFEPILLEQVALKLWEDRLAVRRELAATLKS